ncbi:hypothetical protein [Bdellovibrio bacteriovorus]|uniref:hypothetical protein n=1 Tax=Bdellovibrio bacteriovorus TaxID=959 RepID=UPI0035A5A592
MKWILASLIYAAGLSLAYAQTPPVAAETTESKNESKHPEFNRPLFFSVMDRELKVKNPRVEYDLKKSKGSKLEIGSLTFSNDSFVAKLENDALNFTWDKQLVSSGEISIINQQGKELWKQKAEGEGAWSFNDLKGSKAPQWKDGEKFRFCLRTEVEKGYSGMCTQWYGMEINDSGMQMGLAKSSASPRVILQNEEKKLQGSEEVAVGAPVQFLATLNSEATYEFVSEPLPLVVKDMIQSERPEMVTLTGEMPAPLGVETKPLVGNDYGKVTKLLGFQRTIDVTNDLWQADIAQKNAQLHVPGKAGGVFTYQIEITDPPRQKDRRFISEKTLTGTYLSKDKMMYKDMEDNLHVWEFEAPQKYAKNTVMLDITGEKSTHQGYLDIYRGGAGEASLRLTGVVTNDGEYVIMGEGHVSWWFNDLFGWQNYYLSKQRWGVTAKYFTSLNQLPASDFTGASEDVDLKVMDADLRYRFNPGLWEKDEALGLILAYEAVTLGEFNIPKVGAGIFWARSMPKGIDTVFSKIPFMNYPKWVDMEFIKYIQSMDSDVSLGDDYVLNFHGKVMWTPRFFGEAGFGIKSYYFEKDSDGSGAKLSTFYGTLGMGINF